jgi:ABC-2 type transport system ATP-binding protein
MSGNDAAIQTNHLTKQYKTVLALDSVSLAVPRGVIYGFLGPNGAGKTTLIKILMGFIRPTAGSAAIFGFDVWTHGVDARKRIGFLVQPENLFAEVSGLAHLDHAARLSGGHAPLRASLLDAMDLSPNQLKRRLGSYSKGMRQKLALIAAIQHDPDLLILDEPTDGLDPLIRRNFEVVLRELRARGKTIFMSSHDLGEIERLAELIAIVRGGKLAAEETLAGLKRIQRRRAEITFDGEIPVAALQALPGVVNVVANHRVATVLTEPDVNPLLAFLATAKPRDVVLAPPSLDDIFMEFYEHAEPRDSSS